METRKNTEGNWGTEMEHSKTQVVRVHYMWEELYNMTSNEVILPSTDTELSSSSAHLNIWSLLYDLAVSMPHFHHSITLITPQPFYGPFSGTTRVSRCQKRTSGLYGVRED